MKILSLVSFVFFALPLCSPQAIAQTSPPKGAVLTWHDDNLRTGWQQQETILTTSTLGTLGISHSVALADQVDAQPLVIPGFINGHDIVFVADESNNVYQIDANAGTVLKQVNLGAPVPRPFNCGNGGPNVGINSTPVIDWASQTLFVMADVNVNKATPTYFLHALNLTTLNDRVSPLLVEASHAQTDGAVVSFDATYERERAALLFADGKVYSAFTSYCDLAPSNSRGWLLGWTWNGTTLTALPANQLNDRQPAPAYLLDTVWMSGAGPASDESGNLLFATGNSAASTWTDTVPCAGTATGSVPTSVPCSNIQESVVKLKGDLTEVTGLFSPNAQYGTFSPTTTQLDQADEDLGAGGVLLVPQRGSAFFAAIGGKDGRLFLFDRSGTGLKLLHLYSGGKCFCAPSYFIGPDGVGRLVTSQGHVIQTFKLPTSSLSPEGTSATVSAGQDHGFFTTVSCHGSGAFGNCANTPIIWAVSRPTSSTSGVDLSAFSGLAASGSYRLLFGPVNVGPWPNIGGNSNIVPTVSNGRVYVASWETLAILSPGGTVAPVASLAKAAPEAAAAPAVSPNTAFVVSGTLHSVNGSVLTFTNRHGKERVIDASGAIKKDQIAPALLLGEAYTAIGSSLTSADELRADTIYRAKCRQHDEIAGDLTAQPACTGDQWPPDNDPGQ
jgi:hypothetical protein